ncbi:hypothetical protein Y032_1021g3415 [Ancylostoma ceylanicum]|uniref:SCP domain-containing protein n=1 Tax=Ancylostoma ceylanicum TaxID=53326 RepID=A0A016W7M6_9BILA|nr:hypothetical protein Y032_1021g3415 [Ancylostoma ceylanicum]
MPIQMKGIHDFLHVPTRLTSKVCPTCDPAEDYIRESALYQHNYYRRLLATGWAEDNKITYAKPAKAMFELTYEKSLEEAANKYITNNNGNCPEKAENADLTGENFYVDKNFQLTNEEVIQKAMQQWWSPLKMKGFGDNLQYDNIQDNDVKALANVVYDQTTKMGCAARTCKPQGIIVVDCRYDP